MQTVAEPVRIAVELTRSPTLAAGLHALESPSNTTFPRKVAAAPACSWRLAPTCSVRLPLTVSESSLPTRCVRLRSTVVVSDLWTVSVRFPPS